MDSRDDDGSDWVWQDYLDQGDQVDGNVSSDDAQANSSSTAIGGSRMIIDSTAPLSRPKTTGTVQPSGKYDGMLVDDSLDDDFRGMDRDRSRQSGLTTAPTAQAVTTATPTAPAVTTATLRFQAGKPVAPTDDDGSFDTAVSTNGTLPDADEDMHRLPKDDEDLFIATATSHPAMAHTTAEAHTNKVKADVIVTSTVDAGTVNIATSTARNHLAAVPTAQADVDTVEADDASAANPGTIATSSAEAGTIKTSSSEAGGTTTLSAETVTIATSLEKAGDVMTSSHKAGTIVTSSLESVTTTNATLATLADSGDGVFDTRGAMFNLDRRLKMLIMDLDKGPIEEAPSGDPLVLPALNAPQEILSMGQRIRHVKPLATDNVAEKRKPGAEGKPGQNGTHPIDDGGLTTAAGRESEKETSSPARGRTANGATQKPGSGSIAPSVTPGGNDTFNGAAPLGTGVGPTQANSHASFANRTVAGLVGGSHAGVLGLNLTEGIIIMVCAMVAVLLVIFGLLWLYKRWSGPDTPTKYREYNRLNVSPYSEGPHLRRTSTKDKKEFQEERMHKAMYQVFDNETYLAPADLEPSAISFIKTQEPPAPTAVQRVLSSAPVGISRSLDNLHSKHNPHETSNGPCSVPTKGIVSPALYTPGTNDDDSSGSGSSITTNGSVSPRTPRAGKNRNSAFDILQDIHQVQSDSERSESRPQRRYTQSRSGGRKPGPLRREASLPYIGDSRKKAQQRTNSPVGLKRKSIVQVVSRGHEYAVLESEGPLRPDRQSRRTSLWKSFTGGKKKQETGLNGIYTKTLPT